MNVIAVDDEELALYALNTAICEALPEHPPVCFLRAADALNYARQTTVDVAFLDIEMDSTNGITLAKQLLEIHPTTNIIFVTSYSQYMDDAFDLYASGYIKKPPLVKRIQKELDHLRYPVEHVKPPILVEDIGPYRFEHDTQRVYRNGKDTLLKPKEYQLLRLLASHLDSYFTPEELFQSIWGNDPNGHVHTVYVHISNLRKKLEMTEAAPYYIERKRGIGYRLRKDNP